MSTSLEMLVAALDTARRSLILADQVANDAAARDDHYATSCRVTSFAIRKLLGMGTDVGEADREGYRELCEKFFLLAEEVRKKSGIDVDRDGAFAAYVGSLR